MLLPVALTASAQAPIPMCAHIYAIADLTMTRRQLIPSSETMKVDMRYGEDVLELYNKDAAKMYREIVIEAYQTPRAKSHEDRIEAAKAFGAKWGARCWATPLSKANMR